jgi:hypothetical protein
MQSATFCIFNLQLFAKSSCKKQLLEKSVHLKGGFQLSRLSDGTINVSYKTYPVGKIKLQGRRHSMLVFTRLYKQNPIEGTMDDFIHGIDDWIKSI